MKTHTFCIVLFIAFLISGCGTVASLDHRQANDPVILGGVRTDFKYALSDVNENEWLEKQKFYSPIVDMPFSFLLDFGLLPVTIPMSVFYVFREDG